MAQSREALKYALRLRASQLAERINDYALAERLGKKPWFDTPEQLERAEKELEEILAQIKALENGAALKKLGPRRRPSRRARSAHA
jgi:hypothetical protein